MQYKNSEYSTEILVWFCFALIFLSPLISHCLQSYPENCISPLLNLYFELIVLQMTVLLIKALLKPEIMSRGK